MLTFLYILLLCFSTIAFLRFYKTTLNLRKQIIRLTRQNNRLSDKMQKNLNIRVKFIDVRSKYGIIKNQCNLYIAPIYNSPIINQINRGTKLEIIDGAFIEEQMWYEVSMWNGSKVNNKGWVTDTSISFLDQNIIEISKKGIKVNS